MSHLHNLLEQVHVERERQDGLVKSGKFKFTCAASRLDIVNLANAHSCIDAAKLAILAEEFGEVSRCVAESIISRDRYQPRELMKELIQVAAVAIAWCEAIEMEDLQRH